MRRSERTPSRSSRDSGAIFMKKSNYKILGEIKVVKIRTSYFGFIEDTEERRCFHGCTHPDDIDPEWDTGKRCNKCFVLDNEKETQ